MVTGLKSWVEPQRMHITNGPRHSYLHPPERGDFILWWRSSGGRGEALTEPAVLPSCFFSISTLPEALVLDHVPSTTGFFRSFDSSVLESTIDGP